MNEYNQFMQYNYNIQQQDLYLRLTNYRGKVMNDQKHKTEVLKGWYKILSVVSRFDA